MWTQGNAGHERYDVQEEDHVGRAEVGDIGAQPDFVISPEQLIGEPERNASADERPEKAQAAARPQDLRNERHGSGKQQKALNYVA